MLQGEIQKKGPKGGVQTHQREPARVCFQALRTQRRPGLVLGCSYLFAAGPALQPSGWALAPIPTPSPNKPFHLSPNHQPPDPGKFFVLPGPAAFLIKWEDCSLSFPLYPLFFFLPWWLRSRPLEPGGSGHDFQFCYFLPVRGTAPNTLVSLWVKWAS